MPDERFPADNSPQWEDDPDGLEVPPSVTFMEMMRQAAAKSAKPVPDPAEQLFRRKVQSAPPPTEPTPMPAPAPAQAPTLTTATLVTEQLPAEPVQSPEAAQATAREAAIEEQRIQRIK